MALALVVVGAGIMVIGYSEPAMIGSGARPYAYVSVMAIGAMLTIVGVLMWRDR